MSDSLEAHAVSYAHELETMVREKNGEIARLRDEIVWMRDRAERAEAKADLYWQHLTEAAKDAITGADAHALGHDKPG